MERNAEIRIVNQTGYILKYESEHTDHGKYKQSPTDIAKGDTGIFKVINRDSGSYGPKGTVTYKATVWSNKLPIDIKLVFFWNHPIGKADSSYTAYSEPTGLMNYSLNPARPVGHDQVVTFTVKLQDLEKAYDINNWMRSVKDEASLSSLTIPGTHDSGALHGGIAYECQSMSIEQQLNTGIRFLDIRCKLKNDSLHIFHGDHDMSKSLSEVLDDCRRFLSNHEDECIIMSLKNEGDHSIAQKMSEMIAADEKLWWIDNSIPSLGKVRGKIVLLRRYGADGSDAKGIDALPWGDDSDLFWTHNDEICVQDKYKVYDTAESINGKWHNIEKVLDLANKENDGKMYINFTSGANGISPVMLATGNGIITGEGINEKLFKKLVQSNKCRYGIIVMDYPEKPNETLIPYIINQNAFANVLKAEH
jgi:1-phosphatidylinositol phosphodiesterase